MISPKRIERLWAACPELRPFGLEYDDGSVDQTDETGVCPSWSWHQYGEGYADSFGEVAHALIRDRMTLWWIRGLDLHERGEVLSYAAEVQSGGDVLEWLMCRVESRLNLPEWTEPPTPDVGDFRT